MKPLHNRVDKSVTKRNLSQTLLCRQCNYNAFIQHADKLFAKHLTVHSANEMQ